MKILQVVDVKNWAIGNLAKHIKDGNSHHNIEIIEIHPRDYRNNKDEYNQSFIKTVDKFKPDLIHFHYWDTAKYLSELPELKNYKKILTHHNQKNLLSHTWDEIDQLVVHTQKAKQILNDAGYQDVEVIQHGIDIEHFKYNEKYDHSNRLLGYCGRIVPWKGLLDILKITKELESEVIMMGRIDKPDYWQECLRFSEQMDIRFGTPFLEQPKVYHEMSCYIGNSRDGIEEGTLPLLEAMACGVPVITTPSGEAKDIIEDGKNGILVDFENYESLREGVKRFFLMTSDEKEKMRKKAWDTVRNMSKGIMARKYEKLYQSITYRNDLVSIIIPTCKRAENIKMVLDGYAKQTYKPIEVLVVVDDNKSDDSVKKESYEDILNEWKSKNDIPIKWEYTFNEGYGLAQARNQGIFLAGGHYLVFNDDRFVPEPNAVEMFLNNLKQKKDLSVVWGDKGAGKRDFIENFFAIRKKHIVQAGMFNERINEYGGQSQELRERLRGQGFNLQFEPASMAKPHTRTKSKTKRRYELFRTKEKLWMLKS